MYKSSLSIHSPNQCQCSAINFLWVSQLIMCSINPTDHSLLPGLRKDHSGVFILRCDQAERTFLPCSPFTTQRNLSEGNNQSSACFLIQMQSAWTCPLAMLPTTSSLSVSLVNKLQVNRAAQHFSDFILLFLNTAQMWLAHQPDYLHKDPRRRLPASFKPLAILLRVKKAFKERGLVLLWLWRGEQREKLHHHTLPLCVTPAAQVVQRTVRSALSLITNVNIVLQLTKMPPLGLVCPICSQMTFPPCCWLAFCSFGHLSSFSDTEGLIQ